MKEEQDVLHHVQTNPSNSFSFGLGTYVGTIGMPPCLGLTVEIQKDQTHRLENIFFPPLFDGFPFGFESF
jgi:hypothetical protein